MDLSLTWAQFAPSGTGHLESIGSLSFADCQMLMNLFKQYQNVTLVHIPTDLKNRVSGGSQAHSGGYKFSKI